MSALPIILFSLTLHLLAGWLWIRHVRAERHHNPRMPVIGSDPKLTEALHKRLRRNAPNADWLNPAVMRAKISAWMRSNNADTQPPQTTAHHANSSH